MRAGPAILAVAFAAVTGAAGFLVGRGWSPPASAPPSPPTAPEPTAGTVAAGPRVVHDTLAAAALAAAVRPIVREELERSCRGATSAGMGTEVPAPPSPSRDAEEAMTAARDLVARGLAASRWREADAMELRALMPRLVPAQRDEIVQRLVPAINEGRVAVDGDLRGPPL